MASRFKIFLRYSGNEAEGGLIGAYDAAQAAVGFERVISLATHLALNNEVIVQSPSLKGAQILSSPPEEGSWKYPIIAIVAGALYTGSTSSKDTVAGHLFWSIYDYIVSESLGFHIDFDKTLGQQYEELKEQGIIENGIPQSRFDSVIEKCEAGLIQMHRPIVMSRTARAGRVFMSVGGGDRGLSSTFSSDSYDYISTSYTSDDIEVFCGVITSFNANTFTGRIYVEELERNLPFELTADAATQTSRVMIARNFLATIERRADGDQICFEGFRIESRNGRLKKILVVNLV